MTAARNRQGELRGLILQIDSDLQAIEQLYRTIIKIEDNSETGVPTTGNQMGLALCLHHLYTAMEEIFTRINTVFDKVPLTSGNWHKDLLRNMAMEVEGIRPAAISATVAEVIDEYRAFRHVVRHAYDYKLDWGKLEQLLKKIPEVVKLFVTDINIFKQFVKEAMKSLD